MDGEKEIDDCFSEQQLSGLMEILEQLPPLSLGRNDPCPCESGKKYKKCCLEKDITLQSPKEVRRESFDIKINALTPEESKNNFPPLSEEDEELLQTLYYRLEDDPETIDSENCDYFQKLNALRLKYPDNPVILNYISNGYQHLKQNDKVDELITETYERFPDYLFAQLAQASRYLSDGCTEEALKVLKGSYTLKQLYPHRDVFHISEVSAFEYFMVKYFCAIQNLKQVEIRLRIMEQILEDDNIMLRSARQLFKKAMIFSNLKIATSRLLRARPRITSAS